jgi:aryl-alcohol dehydrogenase-like predicted oxidoreductase
MSEVLKMKMRVLGNTGIKVSELCLGTLTFGGSESIGGLGQKEANLLVAMAIDAGINFFDTADIYSNGESEEICGKALGSRRKDIILATKVRGRTGSGPNEAGLSRRHILEACDSSLKRLGTDYIDLYQVHSFDSITPLEETLRTLDDLVRMGKVRYIGCSNYAGWQLMKALSISEKLGLEKYVTLQALYSLLARDLENELVPLCLDQGLGILVWGPLGDGFLTGKYRRGKPRPRGARLSEMKSSFTPFNEEKGFDIVERLDSIGKNHRASVAQVALNYLLHKEGISSVIIGARTKEQLADNLKTIAWEITQTELAALDEMTKPAAVYPYWFLSANLHDRLSE